MLKRVQHDGFFYFVILNEVMNLINSLDHSFDCAQE